MSSTFEDAWTRAKNIAPLLKLMDLCTSNKRLFQDFGFDSTDAISFYMILFFVRWMEETYKRTSIEQGLLLEDIEEIVRETTTEFFGEEWDNEKNKDFTGKVLSLLTNFNRERLEYTPIWENTNLSVRVHFIRVEMVDGRYRYVLLPETIDMMLLMREVQENLAIEMSVLRLKTCFEKGNYNASLDEIRQIRPLIISQMKHIHEMKRKLNRDALAYTGSEIHKVFVETTETFEKARKVLGDVQTLCIENAKNLSKVEEGMGDSDKVFETKNIKILRTIQEQLENALNDITKLLKSIVDLDYTSRTLLKQDLSTSFFAQNFQIEKDFLNKALENNVKFENIEDILLMLFFKPVKERIFNPQITLNFGRKKKQNEAEELLDDFGEETEESKLKKEAEKKRTEYLRRVTGELFVFLKEAPNHETTLSHFVKHSKELKKETNIDWIQVFAAMLMIVIKEEAQENPSINSFSFGEVLAEFNIKNSLQVSKRENRLVFDYEDNQIDMVDLTIRLENA